MKILTASKISLLLIIMCLCYSCSDSCDKTLQIPNLDNTNVYDNNISDIKNYLATNNLTAQETSSGLHYIIENAGEDKVRPTLCDAVEVAYKGYLLDGQEFDSSSSVSFTLDGLIKGWQEGIPLFGKGGNGIILIPSYLAYGVNPPSNSIIGQNEVLIFDIEVLNF